MIFCNFDPGYFTLEGIQPYREEEIRTLLDSLSMHEDHIFSCGASIPVTDEYFECIINSLETVSEINPVIEGIYKGYVRRLLSRVIKPSLCNGVMDATIEPCMISNRVNEHIKNLWINCLTAAFFQNATELDLESASSMTIIATQESDTPINNVILVSNELQGLFEIEGLSIILPVLKNENDWNGFLCNMLEWPNGLNTSRIEYYGCTQLGIASTSSRNHRPIQFEPSCARDISRESDPSLRNSIIEVIACRAYDQVRPEHKDKPLKGHPGLRHVYVKKMTPPARLHYYFDGESVVYSLYSCGDHDKGL